MNVRFTPILALILFSLLTIQPLQAQWVEWNDVTDDWSNLGIDGEEKDIAIGDLDTLSATT